MGTQLISEVTQFEIIIALWSGFVLLFGYVSLLLKEKLYISEAIVALLVGVAFGPVGANLINPFEWGDTDVITHQLTRVTIAIQVMAVGVYLPHHYLKKEFVSVLVFLFPIMMAMWLVSGFFIYIIIPPLNFLESLVVAACIAPTDPILANSVIKGRFAEKHVPHHIQHILALESGANDGMGFPFLYIAIYLLQNPGNVGAAIGKWFYLTWCYQIILSVVIGIVVGWAARRLLYEAEKRNFIERPSFLVFAIALALFLMSLVGFLGSDDLLSAFAAGNALSWDDWFRKETEESHLNDIIDLLLNLGVFVYVGAIMPWSAFADPTLGLSTWRMLVLAICVLLFRRAPICLLLKPVTPVLHTYREALFVGWFGPMGIGAVFFTIVAREQLHQYATDNPTSLLNNIEPIVLFIVLSSTLVHGTTIPLLKMGRRIRSRTISISSSMNQVSRLPKIEFGQQLSFRRDEDALTREGDSGQQTPQVVVNVLDNNAGARTPKDETTRNEEMNRDSIIKFREPLHPRYMESNENSVRSLRELFRPRGAVEGKKTDGPSSSQHEKEDEEKIEKKEVEKKEIEKNEVEKNEKEGKNVYKEGDKIIIENSDGDVVEEYKRDNEAA